MALFTWIGTDGDWDDPANWDLGSIPTAEDVADFSSTAPATLEGAAYIGQLALAGGDLTISGNFSSDGVHQAAIDDNLDAHTAAYLTIDPWGSLQLDTLTLSMTTLTDFGLLVTQASTVTNALIAGLDSEWLGSETAITGTLAVDDGATFGGNLLLADGASLSIGETSIVEGGTITAQGSASLMLESKASAEASGFTISDDINFDSGSILTILGNGNQQVTLAGGISGSGTLAVIGANLLVGGSGAVAMTMLHSSQADGSNSTLDSPLQEGGSTYELSSSVLDLRQTSSGNAVSLVICSGDVDAIFGGSQAFSVTSNGASLIDVQGGAGANTVDAGLSTLSYIQGFGAADITCGSSGEDNVHVGTGNATVQTGSGAAVQVSGSGQVIVNDGSGACVLDDRSGTGSVTVYDQKSSAMLSILQGSGALSIYVASGPFSVVGGSGQLTAWGGTSVGDTLVGGTGADTLVGGADALVVANGGNAGLFGTSASGATVDGSASTGNDTIFATSGTEASRLIGGSGSDVFLGGSGTDYIQCGSGLDSVWAGSGIDNTVQGGSGGAVIAGGASALVRLAGASSNVVVSIGEGTIIDRSSAAGSLTLYTSGNGVTSIIGGSGDLAALIDHTQLDVSGSKGTSLLWCTSDANVTLSSIGHSTIVADGENDSIDCSNSSGTNTFFLGSATNTSLKLGTCDNSVIAGQGSVDISVSAGINTVFAGEGAMNVSFADLTANSTTTIVDYNSSLDELSFAKGCQITTEQTNWGEVLSDGQQSAFLYDYFGQVNLNVGH